MKKIMIIAAAAAMVLSSCGTGSQSLKTEQDSLAYAVGLDLGNYIKNTDSTLNVDIVASAIKDVIANNQSMDQEQAYAFLREYFTVRKPARVKEQVAQLMSEVETSNAKVQKTESGLMYEIIEAGSDVKATADNDVVRVMYEGKLLTSGNVFDSSYSRGDTAEFGLDKVIKGWGEGLKLVGEGGKIKLWIPSELAYGEQGAGQAIGPNEALVFEVELFSVEKAK